MALDLAAILARTNAATRGPWMVGRDTVLAPAHPSGAVATSVPLNDVEFIAHAREDIPALCEALSNRADETRMRMLEGELAQLKAQTGPLMVMAERVSRRAEALQAAIERVKKVVEKDPKYKQAIEAALREAGE